MPKKYFLGVLNSCDVNFVRIRSIFPIVFSVTYAFLLAGLPMDKYIDRDNYIKYVIDSSDIFMFYLENNLIGLFQNEPVWLIVNIFLGYYFDPDFTVRLIIFFSALVFSYSIFRFDKNSFRFFVLAVVVCLLPQVMKNFIIHLRQGVAVALFVFAITSSSKFVRRGGIILSPLIHSSFFFVVVNYFMALILNVRFGISDNLKRILILFFVCFVSLAVFILIDYSGARQIEEFRSSDFEGGSGLAFLFWLIILIIFLLDNNRIKVLNLFVIASIVGYLTLYYLFAPVARVFESVLPIILITGGRLNSQWRKIFYLIFAIMFLHQWIGPMYMGGEIFRLAI